MLEALLHGKLSREQENMEDVLTSAVFGLLRLFAPVDGIATFLRECRDDAGGFPLRDLALRTVMFEFWPTWRNAGCFPCEPDVVLDCTTEAGDRYLIVVEAKYNSGKSSKGDPTLDRPRDQLAREWDNLVPLARERRAIPLLIYLTADVLFPRSDLQDSRDDYVRHRGPEAPSPTFYWLSWRALPTAFGAAADPMSQALVALAARFRFRFFSGFKVPLRARPIPFRFGRTIAAPEPTPKANPVVAAWDWKRLPRIKPVIWRFQA